MSKMPAGSRCKLLQFIQQVIEKAMVNWKEKERKIVRFAKTHVKFQLYRIVVMGQFISQ